MNPKKKKSNINHLWSSLLIEELLRHGIEYFCIAPGSRSGPLAVAVARNSKAKSFVHYDERGLAFHALGYISATNKPAVIISTSGTAVANLFPAVIEASKKKLPLIVLTADRPPELHKTGADQTIEQPGIFGEYVRWQGDLPCPDLKVKPEFVLTTIDQAIFRASGELRGPVHLNCMFREPLAPISTNENFSKYLEGLKSWQKDHRVYTRYVQAQKSVSTDEIKKLAVTLNETKNGLIVVGKLSSKENHAEQKAVLSLSEKLGWPIFADITSGLRLGCAHPNVIQSFDQILLSDEIRSRLKIDCVLHLGGRMTSRRFYQYLEVIRPPRYIMALNHPLRNDAYHTVTDRFQCSIQSFCESALPFLKQKKPSVQLSLLQKISSRIQKTLNKSLQGENSLSEPLVARLISKYIPKDSGLFLSNSMPIRDMDMYASSDGPVVSIGANRGASGIDGIIASACGFAVGLNKPVTLLIGDLAFLHDLNSLSMLTKLSQPIVIVVLNNDGGAIFSFLPIAQFPDVFEQYFATPHGLEFEQAAKLFGLNYCSPKSASEFIHHYQKRCTGKKSAIIEVKINREENYRIHMDFQKRIKSI